MRTCATLHMQKPTEPSVRFTQTKSAPSTNDDINQTYLSDLCIQLALMQFAHIADLTERRVRKQMLATHRLALALCVVGSRATGVGCDTACGCGGFGGRREVRLLLLLLLTSWRIVFAASRVCVVMGLLRRWWLIVGRARRWLVVLVGIRRGMMMPVSKSRT